MTDELVHATKERRQKGKVVVQKTIRAGVFRECDVAECALDVMRDAERLGWPESAGRRYDAGIWLRQLYLKLHHSDGVAGYQKEVIRGHDDDESEIAQRIEWNWKCYYETGRALKPHWGRLYAVCCENKQPRQNTLWATIDALDALADHRHIA